MRALSGAVLVYFLYLSCDMEECQWAIRHLAQSMSRPTEKAWIELRDLVQYLLGCMSFGLLVRCPSDYDTSDSLLKIFTDSDSDWGSTKDTRAHVRVFLHVVSWPAIAYFTVQVEIKACLLCLRLKLKFAGISGACDGLFLAKCFEFLLEVSVIPKLLIDNSACRYILGRSGCGRARHLSTRILWIQQRIEKRELLVGPIASSETYQTLVQRS